MLHFSNFKITGIVLLLLLGLLFALPNFMREETRLSLPGIIPSGTLNLGLDLQGGSHLLLSVDTDTVQRERLEDLTSDIRLTLRGERIGYSGLSRVAGGVSVTIRDSEDMEKAASVLQGLAQPVTSGVLTSFEQRDDLSIENTEGQTFVLLVTADAIAARNTRTVQQSIEIIRRRVDELGTTEPTIQRQGEKRILVQVPGLDDPERLKALLGQTAKMNFHLVDQTVSGYDVVTGKRPPAGSRLVYSDTEPQVPYVIRRRAMVSGERLVDASVGFDPQTNAPEVNFRFDALGSISDEALVIVTGFVLQLPGEINDHRCMVAGLFAVALAFVDLAAECQLLQIGTQINVINPPSAVSIPCAASVVPPAPVAASRFEQPESVLEIIPERLRQGVAFGIGSHDPPAEPVRVMQVSGLRSDVEIPHNA